MYYIALDEVGDFENFKDKRNTEPVFIGGVIYESDSAEDIDDEKKRISAYLKSVCEAVGKEYPKNLHMGDGSKDEDVAPVKAKISETIADFIQDRDYPGKNGLADRKGKYYIYIYLKGDKGKTNRGDKKIIKAFSDDALGNLYMHMATDVVNRLIFYNPAIDDGSKTYDIDLATRKLVYTYSKNGNRESERKKIEQAIGDIGIRRYYGSKIEDKLKKGEPITEKDYGGNSFMSYDLSNLNNYKLGIERELNDTEEKYVFNNVRVRSISYMEKSAVQMGFLYLSDAVCSVISFKLGEKSGWINEIDKRAKNIAGDNYQLFIYSDIDTAYGNALVKYKHRDYIGVIERLYEAEHVRGNEAEYYKIKLLPDLRNALTKNIDLRKFYDAISQMQTFSYSNAGKRDLLKYMYETLEAMHEAIPEENRGNITEWNRNSFVLYDVGAAAYTHMGDGKRALECIDKSGKYAEYAHFEDRIIHSNKMAVLYQDMFEYEKSYTEAVANTRRCDTICSAMDSVGELTEAVKRLWGIAYSQRGQAESVLNLPEAKDTFEKAMDMMRDDEANRLITMSYYLHHLMAVKDKEAYEKAADEYFETGDLSKQLENIISERKKPAADRRLYFEYALLIYVKSLYTFYLDSIPADVLQGLKDIDKYLKKCKVVVKQEDKIHPWEVIYKYIILILVHTGNADCAEKNFDKLSYVDVELEQITGAIKNNCLRQSYAAFGDCDKEAEYRRKTVECLKLINPDRTMGIDDMSAKEQDSLISSLLKYMYD